MTPEFGPNTTVENHLRNYPPLVHIMEDSLEKHPSPKQRYNFRTRQPRTLDNSLESYSQFTEPSSDSDSDWRPEENEKVHSDGSSIFSGLSEAAADTTTDFDCRAYQRFLQRIFPSKAGRGRLKQLDKLDTLLAKGRKKKRQRSGKVLKSAESDSTPELSGTLSQLLLEEDEDEQMDEAELQDMLGDNMNFKIVFTVGRTNEDDGDVDEEGDDDHSIDGEESGKNSSLLATFGKGDVVEVQDKDWDKYYRGTVLKVAKDGSSCDIKLDNEIFETAKCVKIKYIRAIDPQTLKYETTLAELKALAEVQTGEGKEVLLKKFKELAAAKETKDSIQQKKDLAKAQAANTKKFRAALKLGSAPSDLKCFRSMLPSSQYKILKELADVNKLVRLAKPYRLTLLEAPIPHIFKSIALKKINMLGHMERGSGEYHKIKQWVDAFMKVPFGRIKPLPVCLADGQEKCADFIENAKEVLDKAVYGLTDAKLQVLQYIGQLMSNPDAAGCALAIKGPMGTGKPTLVREGISKILGRPFAFLALGGATDSSFLEGHSYTYEGSIWGKIVDILIQSECMNPVIYFDELDKVSDTPRGEEIIGILTHLTDIAQNSQFHDKYFSSVDFDLSKAMFIFSYNDDSKVNPILRDRMYTITTEGYSSTEKITIARKHLIPKIEADINFKPGQIVIPDPILSHIIEVFAAKEAGVRNLKRCLEIIYTKLNLYRLMRPDTVMFGLEKATKVTFPYTLTRPCVCKFLPRTSSQFPANMYL